VLWLSRRSAASVARERFFETFPLDRAFDKSRLAWRRIALDPLLEGGSLTPARRALDSPIAIAC